LFEEGEAGKGAGGDVAAPAGLFVAIGVWAGNHGGKRFAQLKMKNEELKIEVGGVVVVGV
jgi:hypothetical protein